MNPRKHWIFFHRDGCPFGLLEALTFSGGYGRYLDSASAWNHFYDEGTKARTERAIGQAVTRGVTARLVAHDEYVAELMPELRAGCPHQGGTG